jgi:hypothetical protein
MDLVVRTDCTELPSQHGKELIQASPSERHTYTWSSLPATVIHWNSSNPDTNGTEESVHITEVSLFQGLNRMQEQFLGEKVSLLEVSSFQGLNIMQELDLEEKKMCPHFQGCP